VAKILVIDDDDSVRAVLTYILKEAGHQIVEASNGRKGLDLAKVEPFDLVITDLVMPDVDGLQAIRELRQSNENIKIVAMSGGGLNKPGFYLNVAEKLGANAALSKPFSRSELLLTVDQLVGK
jgi:CheY-like chemotaxis protein